MKEEAPERIVWITTPFGRGAEPVVKHITE
jgi:hypothetical protein